MIDFNYFILTTGGANEGQAELGALKRRATRTHHGGGYQESCRSEAEASRRRNQATASASG